MNDCENDKQVLLAEVNRRIAELVDSEEVSAQEKLQILQKLISLAEKLSGRVTLN